MEQFRKNIFIHLTAFLQVYSIGLSSAILKSSLTPLAVDNRPVTSAQLSIPKDVIHGSQANIAAQMQQLVNKYHNPIQFNMESANSVMQNQQIIQK